MSQDPPTLIDYQRVSTSRPLLWSAHLLPSFSVGAFCVLLTLVSFGVAPVWESAFQRYRMDLPTPTKLLLSFSQWYARDYGIIWISLLAGCVVAGGVRVDRKACDNRPVWRYAIVTIALVLLLTMLYALWCAVAPSAPFIMIGQSVSSSGKH